MKKLEAKIGYSFKNRELLQTALTHSSYANERHREECQSYERLEFLGDSLLGLITAEFLYAHEPMLPEGRMTKLRSELVCETSLHKVALELELGSFMRLGKGEENSGGRQRPSILADMVEAIIAAIYLDCGMERCRSFVMDKVLCNVEISDSHRSADYKTEFQELVQRRANQCISYQMTGESGPDHNKTFTFTVAINGQVVGEGSGRSKKEAEQMAARMALEELRK